MIATGLLVGVDAGGTKMRAAIADPHGRLIAHRESFGVNAAVEGADEAAARIAALLTPALHGRQPAALVAGIAGAWSPRLAGAVAAGLRRATGARRVRVLNDGVAMLEAWAPGEAAVLVAAGTGSLVLGRAAGGRLVRVDGWGPLAGDAGSGYWLGRAAAEAALRAHDGRGRPTAFTRAVLRALRLAHPGDDIHRLYADAAPQRRLSALAPLVLAHARRGDAVARALVHRGGQALVESARTAVRRLGVPRVRLFPVGGLLAPTSPLGAPLRRWARAARGRVLLQQGPVIPEAAALALAGRLAGSPGGMEAAVARLARSQPRRIGARPPDVGLPETERANPATAGFSRLSARGMVRAMSREDARVAPAVARLLPVIARAVTLAERALRRGGRLIYVGAGTSGRLGVLDASEARPTFGVPRTTVVGVLAGGRRALDRGVERAEDRGAAGAGAVRRLRVGARDCVVGLSVSGGAPFVLAAIAAARRRGAATIGITCNPGSRLARAVRVALVPRVGPEAVTGSSRLKAGTAQKMILNMLSTCAFARTGRIEGNLMVHVMPVNVKLRDRAARIVAARLGLAVPEARRRLVRTGWRMDRVLAS